MRFDANDVDVEAERPPRRKIEREGRHKAFLDDEGNQKIVGGCCALVSLGSFIGLIILLCSIHTLDPEEQVVIEGPDGKYVRNGPQKVVLSPSRKKTFRQATRLGPREYAVIKNTRSGEPRHEAGPKLLWLEAYDELQEVRSKVVLQLQEYIRLVDSMTGSERVVVGPEVLVPRPLEISVNGTETAIVLAVEITVLTMNKTTGLLRLINTEGVFTPQPYEVIMEVRTGTLLSPKQFALVKNKITGVFRHELGPQLLKIGAYDELINVSSKVVLQKDQFTLLKDTKTGAQRVVKGPIAFVPKPSESAPTGIKKAAFIDTDTAVLVLERTSGQQRLITTRGVFFPEADEQIIETRELIRVLPHEAVVVRDAQGKVTIHNGATAEGSAAFFLPPYTSIVKMMWSDFGEITTPGVEKAVTKTEVTTIDLRSRKMFFSYEVPTFDNVKLRLDGTIFWKISSVGKMMNTTSDPEGDVWHHSRSALIQAVSKIVFSNFMASFSAITTDAYTAQAADGFYANRGVTISSMELTRFSPVEASTGVILQQIISESINRINLLQVQQSSNEVKAAALAAEILLEQQRTELISTRALNAKLEAETIGDSEGMKLMRAAASFIGGLDQSVPDIDQRVELYKMHQKLKSKNTDTMNLAAGNAKLFMTPSDMNLADDAR